VAIANQKLYVNRADGFVGYGLKKDEFVCDCSDLDDIIAIKRDGTFGTIRWLGDDPTHALLDNVLRETKLVKGDTVVTSGYNAVFPEGILIGTIDSFVKEPDKNFWTVRVRLGINFANLTYVYVVASRPKAERDTVEARTGIPPKGVKRP